MISGDRRLGCHGWQLRLQPVAAAASEGRSRRCLTGAKYHRGGKAWLPREAVVASVARGGGGTRARAEVVCTAREGAARPPRLSASCTPKNTPAADWLTLHA